MIAQQGASVTKLDWTRAGIRSSDPGRVVDVGDYGILPDRLAGRKGNPKVRRKKTKKKAVKPIVASNAPKIEVTPAPRPKNPPKVAGATKKKPKNRKPGGGLTIAEMISRAKIKVDRLVAEIQREERKLAGLREQLKSAERQLQVAQDTPRRSAIGRALHDAQRRATNSSAPHPKA